MSRNAAEAGTLFGPSGQTENMKLYIRLIRRRAKPIHLLYALYGSMAGIGLVIKAIL